MIEILNQQHEHRVPVRRLRTLVENLAEHYRLKKSGLVLAFVDNRTIAQLNRQYRKKDGPTDVLSFPHHEADAEGVFYLGDIVISVPQALEQSVRLKHSLEAELSILTIHGFLHLLGFKHFRDIEAEEEKMRKRFLHD